MLGRTLSVADAREGAESVVVLGFGFWQQRLGSDGPLRKPRLREKRRRELRKQHGGARGPIVEEGPARMGFKRAPLSRP